MTPSPAIGADAVCAAVEATLKEWLPQVIMALGYDDLKAVTTYQQVPSLDALVSASLPAVAIVSPHTTTQPTRSGGNYSAVWEISVGIWDRGKDHHDTQSKIQRWATAIRAAVILGGSMGIASKEARWVSEAYAEMPEQSKARTLAGAEIVFDIAVDNVLDIAAVAALITPGHLAESVHPEITIN